FARRPASALRLAAARFLLQPPLLRGGARLGRAAFPLHLECLSERLDHALDRELAVSPLAAFVLGDRADYRAGLRDHAALLRVGQRDRALDVEDRFGPGLGLLRMLPSGPARAGVAKLDLGARDRDRAGDPNR